MKTRFAPSPTGYMHIGNLRTALYSYLIAKNQDGKFVLRIEDTDQNRYVDGAVDVIFNTLKTTKLIWDEGPIVGGDNAPYFQSERVKNNIYMKYALQLIEQGDAYYCFCPECKTDLDQYKEECNYNVGLGYNGHCRNLSQEEIDKSLKENKPFVIRQKIPKDKIVKFKDMVFGEITFNTNDLDDQVLIKQDGFPTYNFANVIDDHLMQITHIVRGCEYLSSTPKYNLLYNAFGWDIPKYVHLPLIMRQNQNGEVEKFSKRNGSVSFDEFVKNGYLIDAIINYIALLGWSPKTNEEFFTFEELIKRFNIKGITKAPIIFDEVKLKWMNGKHIRKLPFDDFKNIAYPFAKIKNTQLNNYWNILAKDLQNKISVLNEIPTHLDCLINMKEYDLNLFEVERIGLNKELALNILNDIYSIADKNFDFLKENIEALGYTKAQVLSVLRVALTGKESIVLDLYLVSAVLGKQIFKDRLLDAIIKLNN